MARLPREVTRRLIILVLLAAAVAFLLPAFLLTPETNVVRLARDTRRCESNLRQIGVAVRLCATTHGGRYPDSFDELLRDQRLSTDLFVCPVADDKPAPPGTSTLGRGHCSYEYRGRGLTASTVAPSAVIAVEFEPYADAVQREVLYGDGHVALDGAQRPVRVRTSRPATAPLPAH